MKRIVLPSSVIFLLIIAVFLLFPNFEQNAFNLLQEEDTNTFRVAVVSYLLLSLDFLLPIPSSIILFFNGYYFGFSAGFLISTVSLLTSSVLGYLSGYLFKNNIDKYFDKNEIDSSEKLLRRNGDIGIIVTRGIPILSETMTILCGNMSYNFRKFLLFNLVGYIPICFIYCYLGSKSVNEWAFIICFFLNLLIAGCFWVFKEKIVII